MKQNKLVKSRLAAFRKPRDLDKDSMKESESDKPTNTIMLTFTAMECHPVCPAE